MSSSLDNRSATKIEAYLSDRASLVDKHLNTLIPQAKGPSKLWESMAYSLQAGGKRLRPILTLAAVESIGGNPDEALDLACAVECVHTFSLIHDDLPAMDDDDWRRGKPTNHKVYGEGLAVLAGDALLAHALTIVLQSPYPQQPTARLAIASELAHATGPYGLCAGQALDLQMSNVDLDDATLQYIHTHKTGALFRAAIRIGAIAAEATSEQLNALTHYADHLGLVFQIMDDVLDLTGSESSLGKTPGKDFRANKATYPARYGLAESQRLARDLTNQAIVAIEELGSATESLIAIANYLAHRQS